MSERRLTDEEIANGINWRTAHNDDTFTLAALAELRDLRALLAGLDDVALLHARSASADLLRQTGSQKYGRAITDIDAIRAALAAKEGAK